MQVGDRKPTMADAQSRKPIPRESSKSSASSRRASSSCCTSKWKPRASECSSFSIQLNPHPPLKVTRCVSDNRSCYKRASEMKTPSPPGSRGRAGVRISNLPPWLPLLCMVIYISVALTSPNHRRSRGGYRVKLPRHYSGLRTSTRFLLTTLLITWPAWWLNAVLTSAGIIDYSSPIGTAIHTAGVFGPTIAGLSLTPGGFTLKRGLAFTFGGLRRSLPWTVTFLVVPLVLLTAASDGLAEGFSLISAMGVFLAALMVSGGNEELGWRAVLEPELERRIPFFRGLSCHRGDLGPVASAAVVHAGRREGDDPVSCVCGPRRAPLVLAVSALSRGRVRLLLLPSPCVGEHANRAAFAFKHFTCDSRGARPHGALVGRFPPQASNRRGLRRKTGMARSVN